MEPGSRGKLDELGCLTFAIPFSYKPLFVKQDNIIKKALLVVDIQDDFTGPNARMPVDPKQAADMISNLNKIIDRSKEMQLLVVYIGNEYPGYNLFNIFRNFAAVKGTAGVKMDNRLHITTNNYFSKHKGNAFSNPLLEKFLKQLHITQLYIGGVYADGCIYATVKGAVKHHYKTTVLTDCIAAKTAKTLAKMKEKYKKSGAANLTSQELA